jgi:hypothetical protein
VSIDEYKVLFCSKSFSKKYSVGEDLELYFVESATCAARKREHKQKADMIKKFFKYFFLQIYYRKKDGLFSRTRERNGDICVSYIVMAYNLILVKM